jgi:divalent metal cation (Fe/Co/Zn/Cd) transporter
MQGRQLFHVILTRTFPEGKARVSATAQTVTIQQALRRKALRLEYTLISYNVLEGIIAVGAGWRAGSTALVGFGLDSAIEVLAAGILVWRLRHSGSLEEETKREKLALLGVGVTFFLLAGYIPYEAGGSLYRREAPEASWIGIALAVASLIVMPVLGLAKRKIARAMGSRALEADALETLICAYLSFALLLGLSLNAALGWWWADPAAALAMVGYIAKEGWEAVEEARESGE